MSRNVYYATMLLVLVTVAGLSLAWEFWLEDLLLRAFAPGQEPEGTAERWEFVVTTVVFAAIALIAPTVVGGRIIRRDERLHQRMVRLSQEDHLTGLLNRRRISELLDNEIRRAARYRNLFSVILMDVDHFKEVNDRLGHQAGDEVLSAIAGIIRSRVRATDLVGRWGGEEFLIVSPQTDIGGGLALAEEVRERLEAADLEGIGHRTASFGVTVYAPGDDVEAMIARADAALYAAKQGGRNRTEVVPAPGTA